MNKGKIQPPLGFAREDVDLLLSIATHFDWQKFVYRGVSKGSTGDYIRSIAERIEALLPRADQ